MAIVVGTQAQLENAQRNQCIVGQLGYFMAGLYVGEKNRYMRQGLSEAFAMLVRCLGELSYTYDEVPVVKGLLATIYSQRPRPYAKTQAEKNLDARLYGFSRIYDKFLALAEEYARDEREQAWQETHSEEQARDTARETAWYADAE